MVQKEDGALTGDEKTIRTIFLNYFQNLYCPSRSNLTQEEDLGCAAREEIFTQLNQFQHKQIPTTANQKLSSLPNFYEVRRTLFEMGPDKSPGPDGFTARFLQLNWHILGPDIVQQVKLVFQNEEVPVEWLKGHVTLIPKSPEPLTPAEFRPISVGNIMYRLVMKLIANRLKPHIKNIIAQEQNAFIKGRSITDNLIMVKEILHSFSQSNFKQHAFLLKADVNKAFDKLNWSFLSMAMRHLNIPSKIMHIMVSSYSRARITININGKGDGFLTPTQGLRQGCPMSPYIFIISMEILSRMLHMALQVGSIKGVKVAHTRPQITHAIYADDLVLMGDTNEGEVRLLASLLQTFALASGLCISPHKSSLWFSKQCDLQTTNRVQELWRARRVVGDEKYLEVMIGMRGDNKKQGYVLLDKIKSKLCGWKSQMLSHAGRMVMIKSVLMSMPVYSMSLEMLPKGVVRDINRLMAKFLWGKLDQDWHLTFISWQKVCKPIDLGGLGIKDLQNFGEALFLKVVWSIAAEEDKLWVQICKSKYFPVVDFWRANNTRNSSKLWGQIMKMRSFFKDQVRWQLGNGEKVHALSQPWFENWKVQQVAAHKDRKLKVCSLLEDQTGDWNLQELMRLFEQDQVQTILQGTRKPELQGDSSDRLIWLKNKSGKYTVKEGYMDLIRAQQGMQLAQNVNWHHIWKWKSIVPKVKVFLWRLLHHGLPMAVNMHSGFSHFSQTCQKCGEDNEYEMHCLFFCNSSRQVWFGSPLGIIVHNLPVDIVETVQQVMRELDEERASMFANTMWEIWKERNKAVIEHVPFNPQGVLLRAQTMLSPIQEMNGIVRVPNTMLSQARYEYNAHGWQVLIDASWVTSHNAGGAYVVYEKGHVHSIGLHHYEAHDPFVAEAKAMQEAMRYVNDCLNLPGDIIVQVFSDCLNLVMAIV
ncbi:hypothetical protein LUZ63_004155 [Rhynchospora breviuscula]|uniref:Reverse transcriptase domain-containing protein n=1 Tax=Rhynchospora breviuscula TaxID=2022672 RepID=A0A9Q0D202_9POAL|nr:hypothetical protein LUZ63_004155 [Rhynchospora breviuscula]